MGKLLKKSLYIIIRQVTKKRGHFFKKVCPQTESFSLLVYEGQLKRDIFLENYKRFNFWN